MGFFDSIVDTFNQGVDDLEDLFGDRAFQEVKKPLDLGKDAGEAVFNTIKDVPKNVGQAGSDLGDVFTGKKEIGTGLVDVAKDLGKAGGFGLVGLLSSKDSELSKFDKKYDIKPLEEVSGVIQSAEHDVATVGNVAGTLAEDAFDITKFIAENPWALVAGGVAVLLVLRD